MWASSVSLFASKDPTTHLALALTAPAIGGVWKTPLLSPVRMDVPGSPIARCDARGLAEHVFQVPTDQGLGED